MPSKGPEKLVRYCNPAQIPTRVQTQAGDVVILEPWANHDFADLRAVRTFTIELPKSFGDMLTRTGQIKPAPSELFIGNGDNDAQALLDARSRGIEEARRARATLQAEREAGFGDDPLERAIEKYNNPQIHEDASELDVADATPIVAEVRSGARDAVPAAAELGGEGMSRKKKAKD